MVCDTNIPTPYEKIKYVVFDGTTVYDTMFKGNNRTTVQIEFKRSNVTQNAYLLGSSGTSTTYLNAYLASNGNWRYGNKQSVFNTRQIILFTGELSPNKITVNKTSVNISPNAFTTPNTLAVGGRKTSSEVYDNLFKGYIYYFRMMYDDELVVDWIPVRRLSDGLECFWDRVTKSFVEPIQIATTYSYARNIEDEEYEDE